MSNRRISEAVWRRAREDWIASPDPVADIAARHGIHRATLSRRARDEGWPERGSGAEDPASIARTLYTDITHELRASLAAMRRDGPSEPPAAAAQRAPLIRAHRRALIALLDARKPVAKGVAVPDPPDAFPALDLAAARQDILDRLERLDAVPPLPPSSGQ